MMRNREGVRVKICGITCYEDAVEAIDAGADALGFNGFKGSKRWLDLEAASSWMVRLPPLVNRVAVLVNPTLDEVTRVMALPGIDAVQFHGDEPAGFCERFPGYIRAFAACDRSVWERVPEHPGAAALLLDAYVPGAYGGTGKLIDLSLAGAFISEHPALNVILSGGLTPDNVAEAVASTAPYAVDVASGVESAPGRKKADLVRAFIREARAGIQAARRENGIKE